MIDRRHYRWTELWLLLLPSLFLLIGLLALEIVHTQPVSINQKTLPPLDVFTPAFGLIAALLGTHILLNIIAPDADQTLLPIAGMLSSIGVLEATRLGPDEGQPSLGSKQLVFVLIGLALCVLTVWLTQQRLRWLSEYKYIWASVGIVLVGITIAHAHSFSASAPGRDVLTIGSGGFSLQPSELLKICLVIFFAAYLSENSQVLANGGLHLGPVTFPPLKQLGPLLAMLVVALLIFVFVHELGLAILIFGVFLAMVYAATNRLSYVASGLLAFGAFAYIYYQLIQGYARLRVDLVAVAFQPQYATNQGYQIVQGLIAFGSGGIFGVGLGLGRPAFVPAATTDYIAASFAEEFGFAGLLAMIGLFMVLLYRGMAIANRARDGFSQLMAIGLTSIFALQTLVILAGNLKILPLTGVPLPFVAYGGSSLVANFIIIGLLLRLSQSSLDERRKRRETRDEIRQFTPPEYVNGAQPAKWPTADAQQPKGTRAPAGRP